MTFICPKCGDNNLLLDEVCFSYGTKVRYCKKCRNKYQAERREKFGREKEKKYLRDRHLVKTYGITPEEFINKSEKQLNGCAICKQSVEKLSVDHDHKTNKVRDLLCYRCNTTLGLVNDDEILLWKMLEYLKRHNIVAA